jgi:geranylgeranyl reductase family protein
MTRAVTADVIVVGGGPAGSTLAWRLARSGVRTLVLERASMPREKVCGDYVDPRGVQILGAMGCLQSLARAEPVEVSRTATFVDWQCHYRGPIPFYGSADGLPAHGLSVPRSDLDAAMLEAAAGAGAEVHERTTVTEVSAGQDGVSLVCQRASSSARYAAPLIVGADGVNSIVARSQGLAAEDPKRTVVARRAYALGELEAADGPETEVFFGERLYPGYGWVFPAPGGRVNLGIGLLSETRRDRDAQIPALFSEFVEGLRRNHPSCGGLELCSKPIGGVVRTFGAAGPNHFDGGLLVGDAGCFVNPMTGEGITPGMESALLAAPVLLAALEKGDYGAGALKCYEAAFRDYFGPSMIFLDLCAAMLRNRHLTRPWLRALARGCQVAHVDAGFAETSGSFFGGLDVKPLGIIGQVWSRVAEDVALAWPRFLSGASRRDGRPRETTPADLLDWQIALARSALTDTSAHIRWSLELQRLWGELLTSARRSPSDPRAQGLLSDTA